MPLLDFWAADPSAVEKLSIEQIVSAAGDGNLRDDSECSSELRTYLRQISSEKLTEYIEHCLDNKFQDEGFVLQDLVNELGRRLEYEVTNGRYRGTSNHIGNDGHWGNPDGQSLVVEVKTSDAYRISLDKLIEYRDGLARNGEGETDCSVLIVVGRQDTGELEAQVRGSRHAWDVRLISVDALVNLVRLRESTEGSETGTKIRNLLVPREYTRLDEMVDIMFTTARDVEAATEAEIADQEEEHDEVDEDRPQRQWEFTDSDKLQAKREEIIEALNRRENTKLVKRSRALYWSSDRRIRAAFTLSKRYTRPGQVPYWYAYHPQWDEFLGAGESSYLVLGCMDLNSAFAVPLQVLRDVLSKLNVSTRATNNQQYWHIKVLEPSAGEYALQLPKSDESLPLNPYTLELS